MHVLRPAVVIEKNFITDPYYNNFSPVLLNTAVFDGTEGWGSGTADSKIIAGHCGGFNDQKVVSYCKYPSGSDNFGPIVRGVNLYENSRRRYYQARIQGGNARITKVIGNGSSDVHTNIAGPTAFALAAGTLVTITLEIRGSALKASFVADGGSPASVFNMTATDSDIPAGGLIGWRTLASSGGGPGWIRTIRMEAA